MQMNFPTPATQGPIRARRDTFGKVARSMSRSFSIASGSKDSPATSEITPDKSRISPAPSRAPGFSSPGAPYRSNFTSLSYTSSKYPNRSMRLSRNVVVAATRQQVQVHSRVRRHHALDIELLVAALHGVHRRLPLPASPPLQLFRRNIEVKPSRCIDTNSSQFQFFHTGESLGHCKPQAGYIP